MQESGKLVLDGEGSWIEKDASTSYPLPARIEAVIEQRLRMLDQSSRDFLSVASVEGEVFTAEIAAGILGLEPRAALLHLSRDLENRHRLVQAQGEIQVGPNRLNRFQFRHGLFQEYLYDHLGQGEKRRLHREVAERLAKELFGEAADPRQSNPDQLIKFGPALVHHFWLGEAWDLAAAYALEVGKQARGRYAMREAIANFEQALSALEHQVGVPYERIFDAILDWEEAAFKFRPYQEQLQSLARAEAIARQHQDQPRLIQALHWTANVFLSRGLWTRAGPALMECLALAQELNNEQLSVRPIVLQGVDDDLSPTLGKRRYGLTAPWTWLENIMT